MLYQDDDSATSKGMWRARPLIESVIETIALSEELVIWKCDEESTPDPPRHPLFDLSLLSLGHCSQSAYTSQAVQKWKASDFGAAIRRFWIVLNRLFMTETDSVVRESFWSFL